MAKSQLPDPPIAEAQPGSSTAALAALDTADQESATTAATSETTALTDEKKDGDRSEASSGAGEKRGPGRPAGSTKKITANEYSALKKEQVMGIAADQARQIRELQERLADANAGSAITRLAQQEIIDESITEACAATVDLLAAGASAAFDLEIRVKISDREKLASLWARVAKLQLGENAKHSPVAAAALATVSIGWDAYLDAKLRKATPVESVA